MREMTFLLPKRAFLTLILGVLSGACQVSTSPVDKCSVVDRIAPGSPQGEEIEHFTLSSILLAHPEAEVYEPSIEDVRSIDRLEGWILVQASFTAALEPGIFALKQEPDGYSGLRVAWAGQAESSDQLLQEIRSVVPELPAPLVECLRPAEWFLP